jgi:hypothetical protein
MEPNLLLRVPVKGSHTDRITVAAPHQAINGAGYRQIECLACTTTRLMSKSDHADAGECPQCGYLGWELSARLSRGERQRRRGRIEPRRPFSQFLVATPTHH